MILLTVLDVCIVKGVYRKESVPSWRRGSKAETKQEGAKQEGAETKQSHQSRELPPTGSFISQFLLFYGLLRF